jgi:hypothetical protein
VFADKVISQVVAEPLHAPDQLENVEFDPAAAVRVTFVPAGKLALQFVLQLIPTGRLVMVPEPVPAKFTVKALEDGWVETKFAATEVFAESVT